MTLNCSATGYPSPYVAWINASGTVLQNSTNVTSYTISEVTRNDEGNYTCSASNTAGKHVDSTGTLDVQSKLDEDYTILCHGNCCYGSVVSLETIGLFPETRLLIVRLIQPLFVCQYQYQGPRSRGWGGGSGGHVPPPQYS